jgi:Rrf2 family cysteine metabolism transcriptional repressor
MKVSKRGEYGMRALCHLAQRYGEGLVHIKTVAADEEIPPKFLEGILLELKRAGYLTSRRGVDGGYELAKKPDEIRLGEVIRVLDGPLAPMASASELQALMDRNPRQVGFYAVLMDVRNAVSGILDQTSLAEVLQRNVSMQSTVNEPTSVSDGSEED